MHSAGSNAIGNHGSDTTVLAMPGHMPEMPHLPAQTHPRR
jgi:hypothetical protein